ncbi:hypothetical protein B0H13DRAFT_2328278 [Mycena leptocephala]|nr:hypothetical protein B0H13DRAFT_2328278 [Mycena leptocephala]
MSDSGSESESPQRNRFFHPFHEDPHNGDDVAPGTWPPRTLAELRMCHLSAHIRQKPRWWEKIHDENIRKKWMQEAKEQQAHLQSWEQLTNNMLNYVMAELHAYAALRDPKTGIECGPYERIFLSDTLVPQDVTTSLKLAVKPLEDVPEELKDWHPGSGGRVLDLVHPSICPLIFDETWGAFDDGQLGTFESPDADEFGVSSMFVSDRFQWLPSDFEVNNDNTVKLKSPYINNISPKYHAALVPVIERVMECAIPLWEHVLSALRNEPVPSRVADTNRDTDDEVGNISCIWGSEGPEPENAEEQMEQMEDYGAWLQRRLVRGPLFLPDAPPHYENTLTKNLSASLSDSTIQVIIKLASIVLTPEKPEYPGGIWHVEGMATESIVSTFIYYYESENIEPCDLNFRVAIQAPEPHQQFDSSYQHFDSSCMEILYGMRRDHPCVQDIGSVETKAGRCIAFPNLYQHRVSPFQLVDKTKPGVRKILVFFLVDPTFSILSASNVPPQQLEVVRDMLHSQGPSSRLSFLPVELLDYVARLVPGVKSRAEAEVIREELMKERSIMIESVNTEFFAREFHMW